MKSSQLKKINIRISNKQSSHDNNNEVFENSDLKSTLKSFSNKPASSFVIFTDLKNLHEKVQKYPLKSKNYDLDLNDKKQLKTKKFNLDFNEPKITPNSQLNQLTPYMRN